MDPVVLVLSYGATPPMEIVESMNSLLDKLLIIIKSHCSGWQGILTLLQLCLFAY